jgi:GNAT superfamily N-acetyltransferase
MPVAAEYFVGTIDGELVCHVAVAPKFMNKLYRATRLVVMPEWQGAGVGTRFLEWVMEYHKVGNGRCGKRFPTIFHTSHPQLIGYLKRSKKWVLKSKQVYGNNKAKVTRQNGGGCGGHLRGVVGFKYIGEKNEEKT